MTDVLLADDLSICVDCLFMIANGTISDDQDDDADEAHCVKISSIWGSADLVLACDEDCEGWFSWSACDGCGSTLGGDRHPAAAFTVQTS